MVSKICNHCGRLFVGKRCSCRRDKLRSAEYHNSFYDTPVWRRLSRQVRVRDFKCDRLKLYFQKYGKPSGKAGGILFAYVMMNRTGRLTVHHIVPRDDDKSLRYVEDNLITLSSDVHEMVHNLYDTGFKEEVQSLLRQAVASPLP